MSEKIGDLSLEEFGKQLELFNRYWHQHTVLLKSAQGTKLRRSLRSTLNGTLLVYKGLRCRDDELVYSGVQPYAALEAYYSIDIGDSYMSHNDRLEN